MKSKDLAANPHNPRKVSDAKLAQLQKSLREFGDISGVVFNRTTGNLVGGHQRNKNFDDNSEVKITKVFETPSKSGTVALGYILHEGERFAYREVRWPRHKEMAANIAANKGAGEWDLPQLGEWMKELGNFDSDFDIDLTLFDQEERQNFGFDDITVQEHTRTGATGIDEDDLPLQAPARTKRGNIYQLGDHRLMCGDSTLGEEVERLMAGKKADLVFTDPPYNVDYTGKTKLALKIDNDAMDEKDFKNFLDRFFLCLVEVVKPGSAVYISGPLEDGSFINSWLASGLKLQSILVWVKNSLVMGRKDHQYRHEPILYGWREGTAHRWYGGYDKTTVFEFPRPSRSEQHPTMKPVELIETFVRNSSRLGEVVLDPFGGSGSTLIACEKLSRKCFMMELDPVYCDVVVERWEKYTGKTAKLYQKPISRKGPVNQAAFRPTK